MGRAISSVVLLCLWAASSYAQVALSNQIPSAHGMVYSYNSVSKTYEPGLLATTQYVTPGTGDTITVISGRNVNMLINPSGTLAALTVNLPSSPVDGDMVTLSSSQILTTLTVGNGTLIGTLTTLALGGYARFQYNSTANKWFRIG